ncbi:hypothetical protein lbkm_0702 [Lachnospiraceae bacterium KM106-2]|nr:hypothetical protein lbkm_0702 [Lachnospiraceae bacterium KM106-2]
MREKKHGKLKIVIVVFLVLFIFYSIGNNESENNKKETVSKSASAGAVKKDSKEETISATAKKKGSQKKDVKKAKKKETKKQKAKKKEVPLEDLAVSDVKGTSDNYTSYATGKVKNNTDRTYSYVQVEINLYDKSGNQVGSTLDNVTNLEAGSTWKFKAPILEQNVDNFKVKNVTGY